MAAEGGDDQHEPGLEHSHVATTSLPEHITARRATWKSAPAGRGYRLLAALTVALGALAASGCRDAGASPEQPIAFPHKPHTDNDISCGFCHDRFEDYLTAGMPETELCGSCHSVMPQDSEATRELMGYVEREESIPWVRLYELPAYTYFPHKWHVRAEIGCETCHGEIGESLRASRHRELDMAWCVDCHEQRQATVDCVACHK